MPNKTRSKCQNMFIWVNKQRNNKKNQLSICQFYARICILQTECSFDCQASFDLHVEPVENILKPIPKHQFNHPHAHTHSRQQYHDGNLHLVFIVYDTCSNCWHSLGWFMAPHSVVILIRMKLKGNFGIIIIFMQNIHRKRKVLFLQARERGRSFGCHLMN